MRGAAQSVAIPLFALAVSMALFGIFMASIGRSPVDVYALMYKGAFGSWFSWQNSLARAAPLILTALCTAIPARLGLIVIGNEGALVIGGLGAIAAGLALSGEAPITVQIAMLLAGMAAGGLWIAGVGVLRHYRGVNEIISSLMLVYIGIAIFNHTIEGPLRGPSPHRPSTEHIGEHNMIGDIPGIDVHWGLVLGIAFCLVAYFLSRYTVFGFSARVVGGNARAAQICGLPVGRLIVMACFLGGSAGGLAGALEVSAVHGTANSSLVAGYGFTGILVAFIARHNPLAVIPVAILLGGIDASGGLLQRRLDLSDATVLVLQGIIFLVILGSETLYGRMRIFDSRRA